MSMPAASRESPPGYRTGWEQRGHALLPMSAFLRRMAFHLLLGGIFIAVSLGFGMAGYAWLEGMGWTESFLNASMILSGMGPASALHTTAGKWFAGAYALYSGIAFLAVTALLYAPLLHRLLHRFHADEKDLLLDESGEQSKQ
jgi:hypothetical protein